MQNKKEKKQIYIFIIGRRVAIILSRSEEFTYLFIIFNYINLFIY